MRMTWDRCARTLKLSLLPPNSPRISVRRWWWVWWRPSPLGAPSGWRLPEAGKERCIPLTGTVLVPGLLIRDLPHHTIPYLTSTVVQGIKKFYICTNDLTKVKCFYFFGLWKRYVLLFYSCILWYKLPVLYQLHVHIMCTMCYICSYRMVLCSWTEPYMYPLCGMGYGEVSLYILLKGQAVEKSST